MSDVKKVTTDSGFTCKVDKTMLDDWEFAEAAMEASKGGPETLKMVMYMVDHMMPPEDAARLKDHVRTEDGRIPTSCMTQEVLEILGKVGLKN